MLRVHEGKKYKCKFCKERLASKFSIDRHILSVHSNIEKEEDDDNNTAEIVYDRVENIVPESEEDAFIQQQSEEIEELESELIVARKEIKSLRQQLLSIKNDVLRKTKLQK